MRHEQFAKTGSYETVDLESLQLGRPEQTDVFRSAAAAPDIPPIVGKMIVAAYVSLLATFAITLARSKELLLPMAICAVFLTMFFSVPRIFLRIEPKQGERPNLDQFLAKGLDTYTGHCSGSAALGQILIIPALLTLCAVVMGTIAIAAR
jgi:hypothetical protein